MNLYCARPSPAVLRICLCILLFLPLSPLFSAAPPGGVIFDYTSLDKEKKTVTFGGADGVTFKHNGYFGELPVTHFGMEEVWIVPRDQRYVHVVMRVQGPNDHYFTLTVQVRQVKVSGLQKKFSGFIHLVEKSHEKVKIVQEDLDSLKRFSNGKVVTSSKSKDGSSYYTYRKKWYGVVSDVNVMCMEKGEKGTLLIGTMENGLLIWDENTLKIRRITVENTGGLLPSNTITAICLAGKDIWIGTNKGMVIYDGLNFKPVFASDSTVSENVITDITAGHQKMFIGTAMGLTVVNNGGGWNQYNQEDGHLPNNQITRIIVKRNEEDTKEQVLLGTKKGAFEFNENGCQIIDDNLAQLWINDILVDDISPGGTLVCSSQGITRFPIDSETLRINYVPEIIGDQETIPDPWIKSMGMEYIPDMLDSGESAYRKVLWAAGQQKLLFMEDGNWDEIDMALNKIPGSMPSKIVVDNGVLESEIDNKIYVATDKGVAVRKVIRRIENYPARCHINLNNMETVYDMVRFQGDVWFACEKGICNMTQLTLYDEKNWNFYNSDVFDLELINDQYLLAAPKNGGILVYDGENHPVLMTKDQYGWPSDYFTALYYNSRDNLIYAGFDRSGAIGERILIIPFAEPERWKYLNTEMSKPKKERKLVDARMLAPGEITCIRMSGENVYAGTIDSGMFVISDKGWSCERETDTHSIPDNKVRQLVPDQYGNVWAVTRNGLGRYTPDGKWEKYNSGKEGMVLDDYHALAIQDEVAYRMWAGGTGHVDDIGGLTYFNGKSFHCYGNSDLWPAPIYYVFRDGNYLWVYLKGSDHRVLGDALELRRGIYRLDIYNMRGLLRFQGAETKKIPMGIRLEVYVRDRENETHEK